MKPRIISSIVLLIVASLLTACGSSNTPTVLDVNLADFSFSPADVTVPAGSEVTLNLTNSGTLEHEWVIITLGEMATAPFDDDDEPKVYWEKELQPGTEESVTFTAPTEPGEYELVCGTPGHLEAGMVGTLTVVEP